ncbi:MAG: HlyD family secretion protein [Hyphomicrobiaceae bacterium]
MLELMLCSIFTILPDYLYRRYRQGKQFGRELTIFSIWYELRYGISACILLTIALITVVFYNHPSTSRVNALFRTVPILPETVGRVAKIYIEINADVEANTPLLRLDDTKQRAALEVAVRRIAEIEASMIMAKSDLAAAQGQVQEARGAHEQALEELETKQELQRRNASVVSVREIERLQKAAEGRQGALAAATANMEAVETRISILLPAEKASAEAARDQAQVELDKTVVYAGVAGRVEQFVLRVGDVVNPLMRPAGVLIPREGGRAALIAGFGQTEAQVIKVGMIAEAACASKPWQVIPLVVARVQDYIAAGQVRATEQLIDPLQIQQPGTITAYLEPLYKDGLNGIVPGSSCIANAYTSNHGLLANPDIGLVRWLFLHVVDAVSVVHAMILRIKAFVMPIQTLIFSGH